MSQTVKNSPAMPETWVCSLGQEDPLEKGMATHFSILAWKIPWIVEPGQLQSMGSQRVRHNSETNTFITTWVSLLGSNKDYSMGDNRNCASLKTETSKIHRVTLATVNVSKKFVGWNHTKGSKVDLSPFDCKCIQLTYLTNID